MRPPQPRVARPRRVLPHANGTDASILEEPEQKVERMKKQVLATVAVASVFFACCVGWVATARLGAQQARAFASEERGNAQRIDSAVSLSSPTLRRTSSVSVDTAGRPVLNAETEASHPVAPQAAAKRLPSWTWGTNTANANDLLTAWEQYATTQGPGNTVVDELFDVVGASNKTIDGQQVALEAARRGNWRVVGRMLAKGYLPLDEASLPVLTACSNTVPECAFLGALVALAPSFIATTSRHWMVELSNRDSVDIDVAAIKGALLTCFPGNGTVDPACLASSDAERPWFIRPKD
jgi:hypothetical protein